jgi:hypothetical protein
MWTNHASMPMVGIRVRICRMRHNMNEKPEKDIVVAGRLFRVGSNCEVDG